MAAYEAARQAIISLESLDPAANSKFPRLTEADLFMKSVRQKRHVGDSQRTDGRLFRAPGVGNDGGSATSSTIPMSVASPGTSLSFMLPEE
jgi:hypothetical protein